MKKYHERLRRWIPVAAAAAIIAFGIVAPGMAISRTERRIYSTEGSSGLHESTAFYEDSGAAGIILRRIGEMSGEITAGCETLIPGLRRPLDTELSSADAADKAGAFFRRFTFALFPEDMILPAPKEPDAEFCVSADDAALSLWGVSCCGFYTAVDALSGVPLACFIEACAGEEISALEIYSAAADAYNSLYGDVLSCDFPDSPDFVTPVQDCVCCYGTSGRLLLMVSVNPYSIYLFLTTDYDLLDPVG